MDWDRLLRDFLRDDSLDPLLKDAGSMLGCPLLVADIAFHIMGSYVPDGFQDEVFEAALSRGEITYEVASALNGERLPDPADGIFLPVEDSAYTRRFSALNSGGMRLGYLICVDRNGDLAERPKEDFHRLEAILAKQLFCLERRGRIYGTTGEEVLTHLLDGKFSGRAAFYTQAMTTRLINYRPARLVLINLGLYRSLNFRDDMLKHELQREFPQSPPFLYRDEVLLLLEEPEILEPLEALARQNRLRVVVTDPFEDLYLLPQVYQAAQEVMQYLFTHREGPFLVKTGECRNLMRLRHLSQRPDFIDPPVKAVAAYDELHGTQLCLTLYTYCICHHSIQQTCERLFTHRNTVLYRLRKLKEDFGLLLDDPEEAMPLLVSSALALLQSHQDQLFVRDFSLRPGENGEGIQEEWQENGQK